MEYEKQNTADHYQWMLDNETDPLAPRTDCPKSNR